VKTLTIENIGVVVAHFRFIPKLQDTFICKKWLHISPLYGMIPPKEKFQIQLIAKINIQNAQEITAGMETLEDTIILRIENGRDFFLMVSGKYEK
jgi:phosphatidylinositol-bisphosphatase